MRATSRVAPYSSRLEQLRALRVRLDVEIGYEERVEAARNRSLEERVAAAAGPTDLEVRAWALEHGLDVGSRGRVPAHVRNAYLSALAEEATA